MRRQDFAPPDTPAARAARELAEVYHSPALHNHVVRSWLWAEAFAAVESRTTIDHELLYVAAMLHDIGLVPVFDNVALSYEESGGHVAVALTAGAGWPPERRRRTLDVIVRHNWPSVDPALDEVGYLLEIATGLDISGTRAEVLPPSFIDAVLDEHPRDRLAEEFLVSVSEQAARKPGTAARRLVDGGLSTKLARHPHEQRDGP